MAWVLIASLVRVYTRDVRASGLNFRGNDAGLVFLPVQWISLGSVSLWGLVRGVSLLVMVGCRQWEFMSSWE